MSADLHPASAIYTEVRRHPTRGGWAVFALVVTELGNVLYATHDDWILQESAVAAQRDRIDPALEVVLRRVAEQVRTRQGDPNLFDAVEALDLFERLPTRWAPGQFDAV